MLSNYIIYIISIIQQFLKRLFNVLKKKSI